MLTNLLLGIIVIGGILYGFWLMSRMDKWTGDEQELQNYEKEVEYAVIFGENGDDTEVAHWFERAGVRPIFLESIHIEPDWKHVKYVIAISNSDIDNLSVCNLFRKMYPKTEIFSICNENTNIKLYRQTHIIVYSKKEEMLQRLELRLMENEVGAA